MRPENIYLLAFFCSATAIIVLATLSLKRREALYEWRKRRRELDRWLARQEWKGIDHPEGQWYLMREIYALEEYLRRTKPLTGRHHRVLMERWSLIREDAEQTKPADERKEQ
jgi:hypothetical protein